MMGKSLYVTDWFSWSFRHSQFGQYRNLRPLASQDHHSFFYYIRSAGLPSDVPLQSGANETALTGRTVHCLTEHY